MKNKYDYFDIAVWVLISLLWISFLLFWKNKS